MLHEEQFCSNSEQIKSFNKNFCQKSDNSMETIEGHADKSSVDYDVDKMIKEKKNYIKQLNPKQAKRYDFSNKTKVNPTDSILCIINNNFVNTANNKFFDAVNKEFLDEIKLPTRLDKHELNTNITDIGFIINRRAKNTNCAIPNTDNTSERVLSESYLETSYKSLNHL